MPVSAPRACRISGCGNLVPCPDHRKATVTAGARPQTHSIYRTERWAKLSKRVLREEPFCRLRILCEGDRSEVADHIVELLDGGPAFERSNLQGACTRCNVSKGQKAAQARKRVG